MITLCVNVIVTIINEIDGLINQMTITLVLEETGIIVYFFLQILLPMLLIMLTLFTVISLKCVSQVIAIHLVDAKHRGENFHSEQWWQQNQQQQQQQRDTRLTPDVLCVHVHCSSSLSLRPSVMLFYFFSPSSSSHSPWSVHQSTGESLSVWNVNCILLYR